MDGDPIDQLNFKDESGMVNYYREASTNYVDFEGGLKVGAVKIQV